MNKRFLYYNYAVLLKPPKARRVEHSTVQYGAVRTQFLPFIKVCGTAHGSSFKIVYSQCYAVLSIILFPRFARNVREFSCTFTMRMKESERRDRREKIKKICEEKKKGRRCKNMQLSVFPHTSYPILALTCSIEYNKLVVLLLYVSYKLCHLHTHPSGQHASYLAVYTVRVRAMHVAKECLIHVNLQHFFSIL